MRTISSHRRSRWSFVPRLRGLRTQVRRRPAIACINTLLTSDIELHTAQINKILARAPSGTTRRRTLRREGVISVGENDGDGLARGVVSVCSTPGQTEPPATGGWQQGLQLYS